jgi:hypothetical protein
LLHVGAGPVKPDQLDGQGGDAQKAEQENEGEHVGGKLIYDLPEGGLNLRIVHDMMETDDPQGPQGAGQKNETGRKG